MVYHFKALINCLHAYVMRLPVFTPLWGFCPGHFKRLILLEIIKATRIYPFSSVFQPYYMD